MEIGKRIAEFGAGRKISFDGECYHLRLPFEIMRILKKYLGELEKVHWQGIWKDENKFHVVLTFGTMDIEQESETARGENDSDDDYVFLKG